MKIAQNPWGFVSPPEGVSAFGGGAISGIALLINIVLRTLIVIAGVYAVISLVLAGFAYIAAGGDPKRIQDATSKISQSLLGFVVAAGAFLIAAIIGQIFYDDPGALLNIQFFTPS